MWDNRRKLRKDFPLKLHRNPVIAGLAAAVLLIAGCGAPSQSMLRPSYQQVQSAQAFAKRQAGTEANKDWKVLEGEVTKLLPDDLNGSRHQHFLVQVSPKHTVKIAHNIDLAPYVPVKVGDTVEMKCEFIKAQPYDVAHWTHYDPRGGEGGYIKLNGKVYDRLDEK